MQHSAIRQKNETINLFSKTRDSSNECLIYRLLSDGSFSQIAYTSNILSLGNDLYSTEITLPDEDCTIFALFKKQPIVLTVGSPDKFFIYYRVSLGQTVPFKHISDDGGLILDGNLAELDAGFYAHKIDNYSDSIIIVDEKPYEVRLPYPDGAECSLTGAVRIQNNVWQLIAIPRGNVNVKEYFVDSLASKYSVDAKDMIDICTAYFGNENRFRSYIPGVTNPSTSNNFPLIYEDSGIKEITGFWVKTKDMSQIIADVSNITFEWSSI